MCERKWRDADRAEGDAVSLIRVPDDETCREGCPAYSMVQENSALSSCLSCYVYAVCCSGELMAVEVAGANGNKQVCWAL